MPPSQATPEQTVPYQESLPRAPNYPHGAILFAYHTEKSTGVATSGAQAGPCALGSHVQVQLPALPCGQGDMTPRADMTQQRPSLTAAHPLPRLWSRIETLSCDHALAPAQAA